jgi:hypothetical protein
MGIYRVTNGAVGKALPIVGSDTITSASAWFFENQSGVLGSNLTGSSIYSGSGGNISVILSDTIGLQGVVTSLNTDATFTGANPYYAGFSAGSGYITEAGVTTTAVSTVPNSPATVPAGLAVDITVTNPTVTNFVNGTGYVVGPFTTLTDSLNGTGMRGTIDSVFGGIQTLTIFGGTGYEVGDLIFFIQAGAGTVAEANLATAPNGVISADDITISAGKLGTHYSVGDVITIAQAASGFDAKFCIGAVKSDLPVIGDAVVFEAVPAGTILPVAVDYVTATGTVATGLIACK